MCDPAARHFALEQGDVDLFDKFRCRTRADRQNAVHPIRADVAEFEIAILRDKRDRKPVVVRAALHLSGYSESDRRIDKAQSQSY
jgi:hypothetical protein